MRELKPYRTMNGLRTAIDNGGRFYNLFASADDHVVSRGELAKAAGVFTAGTRAFLFLERETQELSSADRQATIDLLDSGLRKRYRRYRPQTLLPSAVEKDCSADQSVIVTGYPRFVGGRKFSGFILIPTGKTVVIVPIADKFDVYEVFDNREMRGPNSIVATVRGHRLTHTGPIRFGGVCAS